MRHVLSIASFVMAAGLAQAEPLMVNKGQWYVTQDIYYEASNAEGPLDLPSEHTTLDECWSLDEEVLIDASMVEMFEGCVATEVTYSDFGMDIGLACSFDNLDVDGAAQFLVSHGRDSFVAQVYLASITKDPVDFQSHIVMIGHKTGACRAPG